jgi:tRNA dimethylallyltransferase
LEASPVKPRAHLAAIVGPTASGKSALGVCLAERLNGEVVVCDSTQVYRGFDIGTGKLSPGEQRGVPHHLMDLLEPHELFTAGDYRRRALDVLEDLARRARLPVFTVGTGLYLRALVEGLADVPTRSEELRARLRARAERRGRDDLHRILTKVDPEAAARIAPRDLPKVIRAIEVCVLSGRRLTELHRAVRPRLEGFEILKIGLVPPRDALYQRINARVEAMLAAGWKEEVRRLVAAGISADAKPFQFIGYPQLREHLEGKLGEAETTAKIQQATRRYAKRQLTWFRREPGVRWFSGFGDDPAIQAAVLAELEPKLAARANWSRAV